MPSTRRSARLASSLGTSPAKAEAPEVALGAKRKSETGSSPAPKRGKKNASMEQKTIEETMDVDQANQTKTQPSADKHESNSVSDVPAAEKEHLTSPSKEKTEEPSQNPQQTTVQNGSQRPLPREEGQKYSDEQSNTEKPSTDANDGNDNSTKPLDSTENQAKDKDEDEPVGTQERSSNCQPQASIDSNGSAIQNHARDDETPSSILEKGIIYFFFRGRVGIDNPSDVEDIARSYLVLRPLPHGARLGHGPIGASENKCRLLALPKKVLPGSGKDRFMTFVEKTHTSFPDLKKSFLPADDYETKTAGVRHTPAATPVAEGVYAITTTGRENHLAYMLTIPNSIGQVQKDVGLDEQGSFIVSCKNPQYPGPSYASMPKGPEFPKEILDEFRSLRWVPLQPKHLDYENTQCMLIGERGSIDKAMDVPEDKRDAKEESPKEELEKLEGEDEIRVKHLKGDDAIFKDLGISKKEYPQVPTTWSD